VTSAAPERDEIPPGAFRAAAWRVLLMCGAVAALIFSFSGQSSDLEQRAAWVADTVIGFAVGFAAARRLVPPAWFRRKLWAAALAIASAVTLPIGAVQLGCAVILNHQRLNWSLAGHVLPTVFVNALVMTGLAFLVRRPMTQTHAAAAGAPAPKFFAHLPTKLKGAELFAVEAEDHYLRLHTSLGQDLILMRLADAIEELEGVEGAQTHRSWWVARAAVTSAERFDGRAVLTLKDGSEAPVSRGFAKALRTAGWF
jgi:hypothetical protein